MQALHEEQWLCQTPVAVTDLDSSNTLRCHVELSFTSSHVVVSTSGIPNHDLESGPSPDKAAEQECLGGAEEAHLTFPDSDLPST